MPFLVPGSCIRLNDPPAMRTHRTGIVERLLSLDDYARQELVALSRADQPAAYELLRIYEVARDMKSARS